jgi:protein-S-isoprenylcysteine O-methyltransferase Ste14
VHSWNIAIGNFFFHYRNVLFPVILTAGALLLQPQIIFDSPMADRILGTLGAGMALLGEAVRFVTIGFEYIHRGGKDGQIYAARLVRGGVYGITRNPMYVGNALIMIGLIVLFGSPWGYFILIPFFLFVYQSIVVAEENYLRNKFGGEYHDYESAVGRYLPTLSRVAESFSGMRFNWRRIVRQEMGTVVGLTIGFILIPVWRTYYLHGIDPSKAAAARAFWLCLGVLVVYFFLKRLKKNNKLFKKSDSLQN